MRNRNTFTLAALLTAITLAAPALAADLNKSGQGTLEAQGAGASAGTANGGIWKTTNGGANFKADGSVRPSGELVPAVMPTDQKTGNAAITDGTSNQAAVQGMYKQYLGRDSGAQGNSAKNASIGLLNPGGVNMPTDQRPNPTGDGTRSGLVGEAYGAFLGRDAGEQQGIIAIDKDSHGIIAIDQESHGRNAGGDASILIGLLHPAEAGGGGAGKGGADGSKAATVTFGGSRSALGSLNRLGSMNDLFANSRGGDQGTGLLLPAVQPVREAANQSGDGAHSAGGGGGAGKVQMQDLHFTPGGSVAQRGAINFVNGANAAGGGGGAGSTLDAKSLNFTNQGGNTGQNAGGSAPHVKVFSGNGATVAGTTQVAPKSLNFTSTARK